MTAKLDRNTKLSGTPLVIIGLLWIFLVCSGFYYNFRYDTAPGRVGSPPVEWPAQKDLLPNPQTYTLVMVVHPRCSCSRASIEELSKIMTHAQGKLEASLLFYAPSTVSDDWVKADRWKEAQEIPGVRTLIDRDGALSNLFAISTSGQSSLYGKNGKLLFSGGITATRGHSGDNLGSQAIIDLINERSPARSRTLSFGCDIHEEAR